MANELRTRDGLPFNFVDGLRIKGVDVTNWDKVFIDQGASYVGFTPVGNLAASNVQAAIAELESEKLAKVDLVTQSANGVMSATDKAKLDNLATSGLVATATNLRPGANQGVVWDNDAFGGTQDTASITLETAGGEATKMRFKMTNDSDDNFEFTAKSGDGLTAYNNAMTLNGNVLLNAANYVDYAAPMISDYAALRAYTGNASQVRITSNGLAGFFYYDAADTTSTDNGGTVIVSNNSKRWKRLFDGAINVKWFMGSEISSIESYSFLSDTTQYFQTAIDTAFSSRCDLWVPAGGYLVSGLYLPGRVFGVTDDRGKSFRIFGQGTGEAFVVNASKGTVIKSVSDAPVLQDYLDTDPSSNGSIEIDHIRFDGTSTTPVVSLKSFFGMATMHDCVVYQRGSGDGVFCSAGATGSIERVYSVNKDWATTSLGAARTGVGFNIATSYNQGLLKISKCTSRGWLTGYNIGGAAQAPLVYLLEHCECSIVRNGIILASNTNKAVVTDCYIEGGDGGVAINNLGNYNTIRDTLIFPGFSIGIQDLSLTNKGSLIEGNIVSIGNISAAKGIAVQSSSAFGGWNKNVINNSIASTPGALGVAGIELIGATPRVNISGNSFDPKGAWTGSGSVKFNNISTGGVFGVITDQSGDWEYAHLSSVAISLFRGNAVITEADVTANLLSIPGGSYFVISATAPVTVQKISAGETAGRIVIFRSTNSNLTIQQTAFIKTASGASFSGPGTITFFIDKSGADSYAYELSRTVF